MNKVIRVISIEIISLNALIALGYTVIIVGGLK